MGSVNKAILVGRLWKDSETRMTPTGKAVSTLHLVTDNFFKKDEQGRPSAEWHTVVIWGERTEEMIRKGLLNKGQHVFVEGRIETRSWTGKDGSKQYKTEIVADRVPVLVGPRPGSGSGREEPAVGPDLPPEQPAETPNDGDIPF
jgi:single-strand DNA-binding protein